MIYQTWQSFLGEMNDNERLRGLNNNHEQWGTAEILSVWALHQNIQLLITITTIPVIIIISAWLMSQEAIDFRVRVRFHDLFYMLSR